MLRQFIFCILLTAFPVLVHGHGLMYNPVPRAVKLNYDIGTKAGWPTAPKGGANKELCLQLSGAAPTQDIPFGKSTINLRANDGANHVGPCKVFLVDPKNSYSTLVVGEMDDCMRSIVPGAGSKGNTIEAKMDINIPATNLPCDPSHCVLRFDWTATHISAANPELYDSCADVRLSGGVASNTPSTNPASTPASSPVASPTQSPPQAPAQQSPPQSPSIPPTQSPTQPPTQAATQVSSTEAPQNTSSGSQKCTGAGPYSNVPGMGRWCDLNCPGYCPPSHCSCTN